ncbi:golgin subfamily A member 2 isoform X4 [Scleropages formosus]|uniref:golgin subfamily A member 2 isoform X4 n=1 Tax=Scleropages formosus TaxID=113540 RepID=UPI0010FAA642|nr:golgin subfamily A member 2 isoform X4 [Scleropages formosus]
MADQSRQTKLAAAKKKLKEFQQKSSPPPGVTGSKKKKKQKAESRTDTPTEERRSPDNALSDGEGRGSPDVPPADTLCGEPTHAPPMSNPANTANSDTTSDDATAQRNSIQDANCSENSLEDDRPLSSTESLRQLSQQLNGLLSESPSSYVNGDSSVTSTSEKQLEMQQSQELSEQLQKERKEFEQKFVKEQGAMREQLQVHIQTIGILVSEKSELQTALSYTQQAARQKTVEAEELSNRLQASKQRVSELERTLSSVSTQQKQFEKHNKELEKERDSLRLEVYRFNQANEEVKQQSSEVSEQLKLRMNENSAMRLELEELRKRLEMADLMIQQFSSQSGPPSSDQQVQMLIEEKLQMESHAAQLLESVAQLQRERDQYAIQIQEEGLVWKDKTEQLLSQVTLLSEERDRLSVQIQELESQVTDLKTSAAIVSLEAEPQDPAQSAGPSDTELALQETVCSLQQEKEALSSQYQAQVHDNEQLSRLCQEQEARLLELEREAERRAEEVEDRRRILEDVQSDKATLSRALTQNRELKEQLAELQNGFVKLTNENMELTSGLQSEQHVKKELARKMGELQEDLHHVKEQLEAKAQEVQAVLEQRDQYLAHLQQYTTGYQQLAVEREDFHRRLLQQTQLMDRLQHDEVQSKVQLDLSRKQLEEAQAKLNQLAKDNEDLKAEVRELLNNTDLFVQSREQGDGLESQSFQKNFQKSSITIPEDFESKEDMEQFLISTLSQLEAQRDETHQRLEEEQRLHKAALQQLAALSKEHQHHISDSAPGGAGVPMEVHEALHAAMEKLQVRFTALMQEKADLRERVEELEHRCIQLSGETDTIGEYIALYQNQRAIMKQKHMEKEQYINMLAKDKEEMKAKLAELQELVLRLVSERNDWHSRYIGATNNPDLLPGGTEPGLPAQRRMELNAVDGPETINMNTAMDLASCHGPLSKLDTQQDPQRVLENQEARLLRPREDGTARQIMQLLQEIQNPQARPAPFLGENPCIPFFYRADEHDEVKILVI